MNHTARSRSKRIRLAALVGAVAAATAMLVQPAFVGSVPGSLDPTFGANGIADLPPLGPDAPAGISAYPTSASVTPSGAVWANEFGSGYNSETSQSSYYHRLTRLTPAGGVVGSIPLGSNQIPPTVLADGESAFVLDGLSIEGTLRRYLPDLSLDTSFGGDGVISLLSDDLGVLPPGCTPGGCQAYFLSVAKGGSGGLLVTVLTGSGVQLVRLTTTGALDPTFNGGAPVTLSDSSFPFSQSLTVDAADRIVSTHQYGVARRLADGTLDPTFGAGGTVSLSAYQDLWSCTALYYGAGCTTVHLPDGSMLLQGSLRATPEDMYGAPGLLHISADGASVQFHEYCTPPNDGGPGVPGCGPIGSPFVSTSGGASELHFITANTLRTLPLPLPDGQLLASTVSSSLNTPVALLSVAPGTTPNVAYGTGARLTSGGSGGYIPAVVRIRLDVEPPPPADPTGTVSPLSGDVDVDAVVPITYSCENAQFCSAFVVDGEVPDPIPPGWFPQGPNVQINSGDQLDTSAPGVKTVVVVAGSSGGTTTFVARARYAIGGEPPPPSNSVSPPSGNFDVGAVVPVTFSCANPQFCSAVVVDGDVPDPLPDGWSPLGQYVPISNGGLLDTSAPGVKSVVVAGPGEPGGVAWVARARYTIGGEPQPPSATVSPPSGTFQVGDHVPVTFSCISASNCQAILVNGEVPNPVPPGWFPPEGNFVFLTSGDLLDTSAAGVKSVMVTGFAGGSPKWLSITRYEIQSPPAGVSGTTVDGGTLATGSAPSAADPLTTSVVTPVGGFVQLVEGTTTASPPGGYGLLGEQVQITAPPQTVAAPLQLTFQLHTSLLEGTAASAVQVWRDGVLVPNCVGGSAATAANPNPCVKQRAALSGSAGARVTVLSSQASTWTFGKLTAVAPSAPTDVVATPGVRSAAVSWSAPASGGGAPISSYVVTATPTVVPSGVTATTRTATVNGSPPATAANVTSLVNGVTYEVTVKARNALVATYGPSSAPSASVEVPDLPAAPEVTGVVPGVGSATVTWSAPESDEALSKFTVVATATRPDSTVHKVTKTVLGSPPDTSTSVTGLLAGLSYSFTVSATSAVGTSAVSAPFGPVSLSAVPAAPVITDVVGGIKAATVSWDPPDSDEPLAKYTVVATATRPDSSVHKVTKTVTAPASSSTLTGLLAGLDYSFTVSATSAVGASPVSAPFGPVGLSDIPAVPVVSDVVGGIRSATVTWDEPDSDEALTRYTVVATATRPDTTVHKVTKSVTGTPPDTSTTVTGLLAGLDYSFTVSATSVVGTSAASTSFGPVTLSDLPGAPVITDAQAGARSATVSWDPSVSDESITRYTVVATAIRPDSSVHRVTKTVLGSPPATSTVVTGLTVGLQYSFTVSATSAVGTSVVSASFGPVTPVFGVSISNRSLTEGNSGQKSFTFTVSLTDAQVVPVTVDVATADSTADSGDYLALATTVTFDPGQRSKTVTIKVIGDTVFEPDEVFFVNLSANSAGLITIGQGSGIILNDDAQLDLVTTKARIAAGHSHACLVTASRTVTCWGTNFEGQIGNGQVTPQVYINGEPEGLPDPTPPTTVPGLSDVVSVAAGEYHTCALSADGTVRCWGYLANQGITVVPRLVPGLSNAVSISAGEYHTCALLADTTVRCWGENSAGELGDGSTIDHASPTTSVSGLSGAVSISSGSVRTCAVLADRTVRCWGGVGFEGSVPGVHTPVEVAGLTGVVMVTVGAGSRHFCALLGDGTVRCWGAGGVLGDGTWLPRSTPVTVSGLSGAVWISAGGDHTCAVLADGGARCWGSNWSGELGDGTQIARLTPVPVVGMTAARQLTGANIGVSCSLLSDETVRCWGSNYHGHLGSGVPFEGSSTPAPVVGLD